MTVTSTAPSAIAKAFLCCSSFSTISRISSTSPLTISSIEVPKRFASRSMLWTSGRVLPVSHPMAHRDATHVESLSELLL